MQHGFRVVVAVAAAVLTPATAPSTVPQHAPSTAPQTAPAAGPVRLLHPALPAPTGPFAVGTVPLHLIDRSRRDPWVADPPYRELMVSAFYPAATTVGYRPARYMQPAAAAHFDEVTLPGYLGLPGGPGLVDWAGVVTHAYLGAPVRRAGGRLPVLLYAPGLGEPRTFATALVTELASRGYLVVTIDHTYESPEVEFPDGRLATLTLPAPDQADAWLRKVLDTRVADTRFVLDELGRQPFLREVADLGAVGAFGHSAGGSAAALAMDADRRIRAGVDLDGRLNAAIEDPAADLFPVAQHGIDRPFLLVGSDGEGGESIGGSPSWRAFWQHARAWCADLTVRGSRHASFTDAQPLLPALGLPADAVEAAVGTLDPVRSVAITVSYLSAFFDRWLRHHDDHLLDGPSPRYPEVDFVGPAGFVVPRR